MVPIVLRKSPLEIAEFESSFSLIYAAPTAPAATFSFRSANRFIRGFVMKVVTSAIETIIENSIGERIPTSRPTFSTTSSTSPRVFIINPSWQASRSTWGRSWR